MPSDSRRGMRVSRFCGGYTVGNGPRYSGSVARAGHALSSGVPAGPTSEMKTPPFPAKKTLLERYPGRGR